MQVAFISGPYRASTVYGIKHNVDIAGAVALKYWKRGYAVICPHKNSAFFDGECPEKVWLDGDIEILRRCDVIVMMSGWEQSEGARADLHEAERCGMPVI